MTIPEYYPPSGESGAWPAPEPHKAGNDPTHTTHQLLAVADARFEAKAEEVRILDEALAESWSLIRELRATIAAKDECIVRLEEYAGGLTRAARKGERV